MAYAAVLEAVAEVNKQDFSYVAEAVRISRERAERAKIKEAEAAAEKQARADQPKMK